MPAYHPRPWRSGSLFGPGPRRRLDPRDRARFRFLLRDHARAGRLSAKAEWVGLALLKRLGEDGQCDPSHDTLAGDAGCSSRTARRATAVMRVLGLLRWTTRLVRDGWRAVQTSNAYELLTAAPTLPCCDGQTGRQTRKLASTTVPQLAPEAVAAAREALAAVLERRRPLVEARLLGKG